MAGAKKPYSGAQVKTIVNNATNRKEPLHRKTTGKYGNNLSLSGNFGVILICIIEKLCKTVPE